MKWDDIQAAKSGKVTKWDDIQAPQVAPQEQGASAADYGQALISGANVLAPSIAGLPVDTARALANLGIAGYGVARKEIGEALGEEGYIPPEPLPPQPGGSEWMREKMTAGTQALGGGDPFAMADPSDPTQQKLQLAGSVLGAGLMAPAAGVKQAALNVARMGVPAAGAVGMQAAFPEEPLAPMVGMMAAPGGIAAIKAGKQKIAPKVEATKAFIKAHKLGYKVPPALAKPTKTQQFVEGGVAGSAVTRQKASVHNQKVTNDLIKKDIGYSKDMPLTPEGLNAIRQQAGKAYDNVKVIGTFKADPSYVKSLDNIAKQGSALAKDFPQAVRKDISKMVNAYSKKQMSAEGTVEAVKQLRAESNAGFRSQDPAIVGMAKAKGKVANALESLMERQAAQTHPNLVPELKAARQKIAKTYTIEKALKAENVDARILGKELDKGKPLSGLTKDVAEFGSKFKSAADPKPLQPTGFRVTDQMLSMGAAIGMQNPVYLLLAGVRPAVRSLILSKPYQAMLAKPNSGAITSAIAKAMKLPERESIAALNAIMAQEAQRSGNAESM